MFELPSFMSFLRHEEIYPFDGGAGFTAGAPTHRLAEFPADYSLAGWSPPVPASASPTASEYEAQPLRTSTDFQRMVGCVLTGCFSSGGKRTPLCKLMLEELARRNHSMRPEERT